MTFHEMTACFSDDEDGGEAMENSSYYSEWA